MSGTTEPRGRLAVASSDPAPSILIGELQHSTAPSYSTRPSGLVILKRVSYSSIFIFGAVNSGTTSG